MMIIVSNLSLASVTSFLKYPNKQYVTQLEPFNIEGQ